jgi:hypothetical protein
MEKPEIKRISDFLSDVYEGICEWNESTTMQIEVTELHKVIALLMDETFKTKDQELKILLATLEYKARQYKQIIEERLAVRN